MSPLLAMALAELNIAGDSHRLRSKPILLYGGGGCGGGLAVLGDRVGGGAGGASSGVVVGVSVATHVAVNIFALLVLLRLLSLS